MASCLLLRGLASREGDRWVLDEHDDETLAAALRKLAPYTTEAQEAALVHERDGEPIAAWTVAGARRLAELVPPAYADLAEALVTRHGR